MSAAGDDSALLAVVQEEIESRWDVAWLYETDKAWDAIHRCLSNGTLDVHAGRPPRNLAVLGGRQLYGGSDYIMSLVSAAQAREVAEALARYRRADFDDAFTALKRTGYEGPADSDDREYTWEYLCGLGEFFAKAAAAGRAVLFTVDQ